jgi:serine phosphatase RsbU (regulator of sigma subunit)
MPSIIFRLLSMFTVLLVPVSGFSQQYEFLNFDAENDLPQPFIYSLVQDSAGHLWIGTGEGLSKYDGFDFRIYNTRDSLSENFITCSFSNSEGIFFGHMNGTISLFNGKGFKRIMAAGGNLTRITSISSDPAGTIWASTLADGFFRIDPSSCTLAGNISAGEEPVNTFLFTNDNEFLAGTNSGLMKFSRKGYMELAGLPGLKIVSLIRIGKSDDYIVASENNGIYLFKDTGDQAEITTFAKGTEIKGIQGICRGQNSDLWVATFGSGLVRLSTGDDGTVTISLFNRLTGYPSDNVKTVWEDREGVIWGGNFGEGLTRIIPRTAMLSDFGQGAELPVAKPFMPYFTSVRINDDELDPGISSVSLPAGKYTLRIQFLAVSLKSPDMVRYQTFMEGYDEEWSEVSGNNVVVYNSLTGGKYRFLLRSFNSDGIIASTPISLDITISHPSWKKWWFYPVLAVLLGIIVLYYLKWKERQHRQEKRILEERVKERISEIELQKNELAAQRDEIDEKNLSIMSSITYARQIQKAILPPREVLDRAFPENFVLHKPKDIVSGDFYWMAERNNRIIFSVADCTGHGVPGAFMSLLGITLLNEIVNVNGITQSDIIVTELRRRLVQAIQQSKSGIQTYDGMDISLCVFDPEKRKLQFTGGMNHMVKIRDGKLEVIRADKLDVSASHKNEGAFNLREVDCIHGDMIYLFSDGYQDQFGGEYNKKFLRPHFYTTLVEVHRLHVAEQKEALETKLMNWMKNHPQTDDITIVGIRMC